MCTQGGDLSVAVFVSHPPIYQRVHGFFLASICADEDTVSLSTLMVSLKFAIRYGYVAMAFGKGSSCARRLSCL